MFTDTLMLATDAGGYGAEQLDQQNSGGAPSLNLSYKEGWQSFTPGVTGLFSAVELYQNLTTTNRRFKVYSGEGVGGTLLLTKEFGGGGTKGAWRKFEFGDDAVEITSGSKFTLFFEDMASPQVSVGIYMDLGGDHYAGGRMGLSPLYDYLFKTYMKPAL